MTVIAASVETLPAGTTGAWFDVTGNSFIADVDNAKMVQIQSRRGATDTSPKIVASEKTGADVAPKIVGPCSVVVACVPGRQYRFVSITGPAMVAADQ